MPVGEKKEQTRTESLFRVLGAGKAMRLWEGVFTAHSPFKR